MKFVKLAFLKAIGRLSVQNGFHFGLFTAFLFKNGTLSIEIDAKKTELVTEKSEKSEKVFLWR